MPDFQRANDAEAARHNEETVQRDSVSHRVNERDAGEELTRQSVAALLDDADDPAEGEAYDPHDDPDAGSDSYGIPNWV